MDERDTAQSPEEYWESRYADATHIWSGRVNAATADVVIDLPPGRALDVGCGEGGDAIWLAQRGWRVTAVDISRTAIERGAAAAEAAGVADRVEWISHNLATWVGEGSYDLVTASFFHSTVELPRTDILRRAASLVTPGGHLLIVAHADFPPWSAAHNHGDAAAHEHRFLSPEEEIAELALPADAWQTIRAEVRTRNATGPDGQTATLDDVVVLLRRQP